MQNNICINKQSTHKNRKFKIVLNLIFVLNFVVAIINKQLKVL